MIVAVGNLDHDRLVELARQHLGRLPSQPVADVTPATYQGSARCDTRPLKEVQFLLGFAAPSLSDNAFATAHIYSAILGGGMASRLFQSLREQRGLCYSVNSFYWPFTDTGVFGIHMATSEDEIEEAVSVTLDELGKMTESVTPAELGRAKAQLRAGLLMTLESPVARAGQIARHISVHGRPLALEESLAIVDAVTADDLITLSQSMFATRPTLATVGPLRQSPDLDDIAGRINAFSAAA